MNVCRTAVLPVLMLAIATPLAAQDTPPATGTKEEAPVVQGKRQTAVRVRPLDRIQSRIDSRIQNRVQSRAGATTAPDVGGSLLSAPR